MSAISAQPVGNEAAQGGISGLGFWRYRTEIVTPPASGQLRFDNADPTLATEFYLHETNDNGSDVSGFLALIATGAVFYIQLQGDSGRYVIVEVGLPVDSGVYWTFPITQLVQTGTTFSQNNTVGVFVTQPGAGLATTLQAAYNAAPTANPHILTQDAANPIRIQAPVTGPVIQIKDTFGANIFEVDDTFVEVDGNLRIVDAFINHAAPIGLTFEDTFTTGGSFIGGSLSSIGTITYNNSTTIIGTFAENKTFRAAVGPGFAAYTVMNVLPAIENAGNFNLVGAIGVNFGAQHRRITAGTSVVTNTIGFSYAAQVKATVAGAVMSRTLQIGLAMSPTFSTVAGSTANLGTIIGLQCNNPAVGIFQPQAGAETMTAYYGLIMNAIPFGGNVPKAAVQSGLLAATNSHFLNNVGTAHSNFGTSHIYFDDNFGVALGGVGTGAFDAWISWNVAGYVRTFFVSSSDELRLSSPGADRFLLTANAPAVAEYDLDFARFNFGAAGAVGNQAFNFTQKARTVTVAGGYASALFTAGGNLNLGVLAMSDVSAWVVNALSFANTAYSITELATFKVGGMTTSNPGGTVTSRAAFWNTGRFLQRGSVQYVPITPAALGSGNVNDWAGLLTGSPNNNSRRWARIAGDAVTSVLTGIDATAVQDGDTFELTNVSANSIDITNQDAASVAANRIITGTGATFALGSDRTVTIRYDSTTARWRLLERT